MLWLVSLTALLSLVAELGVTGGVREVLALARMNSELAIELGLLALLAIVFFALGLQNTALHLRARREGERS